VPPRIGNCLIDTLSPVSAFLENRRESALAEHGNVADSGDCRMQVRRNPILSLTVDNFLPGVSRTGREGAETIGFH
jgi:hypothetical protein